MPLKDIIDQPVIILPRSAMKSRSRTRDMDQVAVSNDPESIRRCQEGD